MEKLSRKHHLKWFLDFLPTSLKRLVAKADQKVNQGCENSLVKIYRNVQVITHAAMIIAFNFILFTFLWPTSNSVFLVKSSIEDILRLFYVYPWPTWKISNVTWDKQNLMWHCQFCHNFVAAAALKELTNDKGQTKLQWDDRKQTRQDFWKDPQIKIDITKTTQTSEIKGKNSAKDWKCYSDQVSLWQLLSHELLFEQSSSRKKKSFKIPTDEAAVGRKNLEARYQILAAMTLQKPQETLSKLWVFDIRKKYL